MPRIPSPEALLEIAQSTLRKIEDKEWKKYQRYLAKHAKQNGNTPTEEPLKFEEFCARLAESENDSQDMRKPP